MELKNNTIFHEKRFLSYHGDRFVDRSIMIGDYWFPAAEIDNVLFSHPGASFGGVVLPVNSTMKKTNDVVKHIIKYADGKEIFMRLSPYVYHKYPSDELDYSLLHNGFELSNTDVCLVIPVENNLEDWKSSCLRSDTKRSMKKKQGVTVAWSGDYYPYWKILSQNLESKYGVKPVHTVPEILTLKELYPYNIWLLGCYYEDKMIGGIVIIVASDICFETFYIAQDYEYQKYRPLNLIMEEVYRWAYKHKFKYINLGVSTENNGRDVNWGLFRFKEGFGANSILRKSYRLRSDR